MASARSAADIRGQGPSSKAVAGGGDGTVDVGFGDAAGVDAITSSVKGETTSKRSLVAGSTHSPPMKSLSKLGTSAMCRPPGGSI